MSRDIFYYNLSIGNNNPNDLITTSLIPANIQANNNIPICDNPEDYYCSIIRFQIPSINVPLVQFLVQSPVSNINLGIYSFTVGDGTTYGAQTFVIYIPQVILPPNLIPSVQSPPAPQQFTDYYFLYDYTWFINLLNTAIATATTSFNPALIAPFFYYDATTQLITLYTDSTTWNTSPSSPKLYFNSPLRNFLNGLSYNFVRLVSPPNLGLDNVINIQNFNGINEGTIPPSPTIYTKTIFQYNAYGYWSFLKGILITTSMNVISEMFFVNTPNSQQNVQYVNVLTDYLPDLALQNGAGVPAQIFDYNAPSLYRVFQFKQKTPLYNVNLAINILDNYNNIYPLNLDVSQQASFKLMFIKKSLWSPTNQFQN